jgi:elongation factor Ts
MAVITAKMVADLRAQTGCGMMDCKKALVEADGNFEEAVKVLREKGLAKADSKQSRIAAEGIVDIMLTDDKKTAAMIEVNTETDFVAKNEKFQEFVKGLLKTVLANRPADVEALNACKFDGTEDTVEVVLKEQIFKIGEKISIRRFAIVDGIVANYIHGNGGMGVVVNFDTDVADNAGFAEYAKNIALQLAANPCEYVDRTAVPQSVIDKELEIIMSQIKNDPKNANKPDQIIEKMAQGKIGKYYEEHCLVDQEYVKDDKMKVSAYTAACAKEFGGSIAIKSFVIFTKGEGIEKREDNFAEEIANMVSGK